MLAFWSSHRFRRRERPFTHRPPRTPLLWHSFNCLRRNYGFVLLFAFRDFALSSRRNINGAQHEMIRGEGEEWEALRRSWVSNLERVVMKKKLYNARFCLGGWSLRLEVGRQIQKHNAIIPLIFIWKESARLEGQWTDFFTRWCHCGRSSQPGWRFNEIEVDDEMCP